ncbi:MAG: DUF2807 domain-containing protein [Planctomycetales bacterium]|nr:DUF2807 domain-containing protein [Planctomycetales bacterium]
MNRVPPYTGRTFFAGSRGFKVLRIWALGMILPFMATIGCVVTHVGIPGSGVSLSEIRELEAFDSVSVSGVATVNIEIGELAKCEVTADDNLVPLVETKVVDGELQIGLSESVSMKTPIVVDLVLPKLRGINMSGATTGLVSGLSSDSLQVDLSGASELTIATGACQQVNVDTSGVAEAQLKDLVVSHAKVSTSGTSRVEVTAKESLIADASGASEVVCYGNPARVEKDTSGVADIVLN